MSHSQLQVLFLLTIQNFSTFGCKEYNQFDFSIDHLVMSICRVTFHVVERRYLLWSVCSLDRTLLAFAWLQFVFQGQHYLLFQGLLTTCFCIPIPCDGKDISFWCQFQKVLQVFIEWFNFTFCSFSVWGIVLNCCDAEQFSLETNLDHSVIFCEIAPKYCILHSFV